MNRRHWRLALRFTPVVAERVPLAHRSSFHSGRCYRKSTGLPAVSPSARSLLNRRHWRLATSHALIIDIRWSVI